MLRSSASAQRDESVRAGFVVREAIFTRPRTPRCAAEPLGDVAPRRKSRRLIGQICAAVLAAIPAVALTFALEYALPHETLRVRGQSGTLTLPNGFAVKFSNGAVGSVLEGETLSVLRVFSGSILVGPVRVPAQPLLVSTADVQVEVDDAVVCLQVRPMVTVITVLSGAVQLSANSSAERIVVHAGRAEQRLIMQPLAVVAGDQLEITRTESRLRVHLMSFPGFRSVAQTFQATDTCSPESKSLAPLG